MKLKIMFGLVLLMLLVGCTRPVQTGLPDAVDIHTGTKGLELEFVEGAPPKEIYVGKKYFETPLDLVVGMKNHGAYDIKEGRLGISYDEAINSVDYNSLTFNLEGKKDYKTEGDFDTKTFRAKNFGLPVNKQTVFTVSGCYKYRTEASAEICVGQPVIETLRVSKQACNPKDYAIINLAGGQGGPVAVTKIQESVRPKGEFEYDIVFAIDIENVGGGFIRSESAYDKECLSKSDNIEDTKKLQLNKSEITTAEIKQLEFSDYSLSNGRIRCEGDAKLRVGEKTIICRATIDKQQNRGAFLSNLKMVIDYGYVTREYATVKVKETNEI